jgi:hypothetical protein
MSGVTAASVAAYAAAAAAVVGAYSSIQQGKQQQKMADDQAQQAVNDGAYQQDAAKAQAEKIRKLGALQKSEARAALAASGVKVGEGTALEVEKEITAASEEDALTALLGGKRSAQSMQEEARLLTKAGTNARNNANTSALASVASAGARAYSGWKGVK